MAMTSQELVSEMEHIAEIGDANLLEKFVLDHFADFPEDIQGKLLLDFYSQAIDTEAGESAIIEMQQEGIDAMRKIDEIEVSMKNASPDA